MKSKNFELSGQFGVLTVWIIWYLVCRDYLGSGVQTIRTIRCLNSLFDFADRVSVCINHLPK